MNKTIDERVETAGEMYSAGFADLPAFLSLLADSEAITDPVEWLQLLELSTANLVAAQLQGILNEAPTPGDVGTIVPACIDTPDDEQRRLLCLAEMLNCLPSELEIEGDGTYGHGVSISHGRAEYSVMTEDEANDAWEDSLDSYLEECVYPELPENMRCYFDDEAWKRDARIDGRGHSLSSYGGSEEDAREFCVFRTN